MKNPHIKPIDARLINRIADRAYNRIEYLQIPRYTRASCARDITMLHCWYCPLDLHGLLKAPDLSFLHDVLGIRINLDRRLRLLRNNFEPHFRKPGLSPSLTTTPEA